MMKITWLKKFYKKIWFRKEFYTAKEALERTKEPQLKNSINKINTAVDMGLSHTYIGDDEKLHQETIDYLTERGYDIKVTYYKMDESGFRIHDDYINEVFWHRGTTGQYSYKEK